MVYIKVSADDYRAADFLRQLANEIEAREDELIEDFGFETEIGNAEIEFDYD